MRLAFEEMIYWLEEEYRIPAPEGYMLLGQIAEATMHPGGQSEIHLHLQGQQERHCEVFRLMGSVVTAARSTNEGE